ncbi:MAG TPA: 50S ribosomal protein L32 [Pseudogracilibacillus sp.]|nr:50S ribosomal protein L32 [Pseudogracilibacillus sp.]
MAVPKRRTSKKVTRQRRTHKKLHVPGLVECASCGELTKPHYVCKACGHYDGDEVVEKN